MIFDFHAHYINNAYKKPFRYLSYDKDGYALKEGGLPQLIQEMEDANICYFIELCVEYHSRIFPVMGITQSGLFMRNGLTERNWMHLQR